MNNLIVCGSGKRKGKKILKTSMILKIFIFLFKTPEYWPIRYRVNINSRGIKITQKNEFINPCEPSISLKALIRMWFFGLTIKTGVSK